MHGFPIKFRWSLLLGKVHFNHAGKHLYASAMAKTMSNFLQVKFRKKPYMRDSRNLARALYDGTFWLSYGIGQSLGDGHCLLHAFIALMKSQYPQLATIEMTALLNSIVSETYANLSAYVQFLIDSLSSVSSV